MSSLSGIKCWGEPLPPQEFLRKYGLPQIVRVFEGNRVQGPARVDLDRPLLLYKAYICQQVHARSIDRDKNGGITSVGPPLILPDTYPGWLAVITEEGHTAGYFSSVCEVASAQVPYFLSKEQTQGYKEATDSKGNTRYVKVKIKAGEVLQFLGAYEDTTYSSKHSKPLRYAKVVDRQGDLLYLPFPTPGKFFSVAGRRTRSISHVYRLSQLLAVANLPLTVRVVSGDRPRSARCPFTGLLRLEWSEERHVILACALKGGLGGGEPTLLEVDTGSEFSFLRPLDEQKARLTKAFNRMLRYCSERGETWRQQIKVAHHVLPTMKSTGAGSSGDTYEDEDSAVRSSTVKSMSSTKSSASSRLFKRLRLLHQSWKGGLHRNGSNNASGSDDSGIRRDRLPPSTSDFHLYERVRDARGFQQRASWGRSSISTEILDDDGYVTSDFGGEDSSTYDSVC
ncbi:CABIT domain-containing protein [Trichonephila inaurata madagascariensis]|uniref:CABIT domain-containing protein n=1 Tax=Trichonephila inaurata madagascariensis TaxID=2747483 RepID=A0A8X6JLW6_9ARAC|nr:CABIT domain-containing protein [Trichonephila inaurata madagascariensis]